MQVIVGAFDEHVPLAGFDDEHVAGLQPDRLAVGLGETVTPTVPSIIRELPEVRLRRRLWFGPRGRTEPQGLAGRRR